jgi:hypothetical protein
MGVYIEIQKISETAAEAVYEYIPEFDKSRAGRLVIDKRSGKVKELESGHAGSSNSHFVRAASKILRHHQNGEYPEHTCWAS